VYHLRILDETELAFKVNHIPLTVHNRSLNTQHKQHKAVSKRGERRRAFVPRRSIPLGAISTKIFDD